ncbi:glycosyltransferase [Halorubrum ezzemoulense]|uniref:Colanic acid biosynthesis glycosyltransferase WcaL n=1 Tax=Halorubrum ezzemoulense TaxID=337243 RepID=A0A256JEE4_HALEZ|nr:glycosyltransferase [Halorubrum ezzemoulense]OYR67225.1 colanic acid biosynthesis glycosyltransferase WcaL [Halorubrum ezzemoulense]
MNILYYLEYYPKLSESWIRSEIRQLRNEGHRVVVLAHKSPDSDVDDPANRSITLPSISFDGFKKFDPFSTAFRGWASSPLPTIDPRYHLYTLYHASHARSTLQSLPFEIEHIHGHFVTVPQICAQHLADTIGVPHTVMSHAADLYAANDAMPRQYLYKNCDRLLTISDYNREFMEEESREPINIEVLPACFDFETFTPSDGHDKGRLLTVARHTEKKGISYALEAISHLYDDYEVEYRLVSDGPLTEDLKKQARTLGIQDSVNFLGRISDEELHEELDAAELFVLPSVIAENGDRDGIPVAIKEAMAMKTPPITTTVSGIPELVDESCGYLVPPRDSEALADVLTVALDESHREKGEAARNRIETHNSDVVVPQLLDVFSKISTS